MFRARDTTTAARARLFVPAVLVAMGLLSACVDPDSVPNAASPSTSEPSSGSESSVATGTSVTTTSEASAVGDSAADTDSTPSSTTAIEEPTTSTTPTGPTCDAGVLPADAALVDGYREFELCGWQVFMNEELYEDELATPVYDALQEDMQMIIDVVPAPAVAFLRDTTIWLELDVPAFPGGVYHPSSQWLRENGYPEKWAEGVQFGNAVNYLEWVAQQPAMLLHELTHALHHQRYDFVQPDVTAAYDAAMQQGLYDSVEYVDGGLQQAYAATNDIEYLAEASEAYFWSNDFYPFDRADLADHDPAGLAVVELIWEAD